MLEEIRYRLKQEVKEASPYVLTLRMKVNSSVDYNQLIAEKYPESRLKSLSDDFIDSLAFSSILKEQLDTHFLDWVPEDGAPTIMELARQLAKQFDEDIFVAYIPEAAKEQILDRIISNLINVYRSYIDQIGNDELMEKLEEYKSTAQLAEYYVANVFEKIHTDIHKNYVEQISTKIKLSNLGTQQIFRKITTNLKDIFSLYKETSNDYIASTSDIVKMVEVLKNNKKEIENRILSSLSKAELMDELIEWYDYNREETKQFINEFGLSELIEGISLIANATWARYARETYYLGADKNQELTLEEIFRKAIDRGLIDIITDVDVEWDIVTNYDPDEIHVWAKKQIFADSQINSIEEYGDQKYDERY